MAALQFVVSIASVGVAMSGTSIASAQDYPNKPIRIVTSNVGGGTDFTARLVAQGLSELFGQSVFVENRGSAFLTAELVAKAAPDGYTLLAPGNSLWHAPLLQTVNYDPVRDFSPVSLLVIAPNILVVHPSLPVKSVKDLIALAKARPRDLNYGTSGNGTSTHLSAELFKSMAGIDIVRVNYKGTAPAYTGLIAGEVQMIFSAPGGVAPHIKSGRLRPLAVTSANSSALFPGLPTVSASGVPGYESAVPHGLVSPAKTPAAIINRLHQDIVKVLNRPEAKEKFFNIGIEVVAGTPEQFASYIKSDMARLGKVIKEAGIRAD